VGGAAHSPCDQRPPRGLTERSWRCFSALPPTKSSSDRTGSDVRKADKTNAALLWRRGRVSTTPWSRRWRGRSVATNAPRRLCSKDSREIQIKEGSDADLLFTQLTGDPVEPRRDFTQDNERGHLEA